MTPYLNITFPCGRTYQIATAPILEHAAKNDAVLSDDDALMAYVNTLPWPEVEEHARLMNVQVSLEAEWDSAVLVPADSPMGYPKPNAERLLQQPMAVTLGALAQEGTDAQIGMIANAAGTPVAAIIVVQGPPDIVTGYAGVVEQFAQFLSQRAAATQEQAATTVK